MVQCFVLFVVLMLRPSTSFYFLVVCQWIYGLFCPDGGRWICLFFSFISEWISWIDSARIPLQVKRCLDGVVNTMFWMLWSFQNIFLFAKDKSLKAVMCDLIQSQSLFWIKSRCPKFKVNWVDWVKNSYFVIL